MNSNHIHIESVTISERYIALVQCYESMYNVGVRPICQHNFGNNRMLKEPRIMLE